MNRLSLCAGLMALAVLVALVGVVGVTEAQAVRTVLTPITPKGPYPSLPVAADALDLTWTAADTTNQNRFVLTGSYLVLVRNSHATTAYTVTFTSTADSKGRSGDVSAYSLAAGEVAAFMVNSTEGWKQTDGYFWLEANNASVLFAIVKLP